MQLNGNSVTVISCVDAGGKPDILIKGDKCGQGAAGDVFKWVSIRTQQTEAHKVATDMAGESDGAAKGQRIRDYLGDHDSRLVSILQENGQTRKVEASHYFEYGGAGNDVAARQFQMAVGKAQSQDNVDVNQLVEKLCAKLATDLSAAPSADEKRKIVQDFRGEIGLAVAKISSEKFESFEMVCKEMMRQIDEEAKSSL